MFFQAKTPQTAKPTPNKTQTATPPKNIARAPEKTQKTSQNTHQTPETPLPSLPHQEING